VLQFGIPWSWKLFLMRGRAVKDLLPSGLLIGEGFCDPDKGGKVIESTHFVPVDICEPFRGILEGIVLGIKGFVRF